MPFLKPLQGIFPAQFRIYYYLILNIDIIYYNIILLYSETAKLLKVEQFSAQNLIYWQKSNLSAKLSFY